MSPVGARVLFWQPEDRLMSAALMFNNSSGLTASLSQPSMTPSRCTLSLPSSVSSLSAAAQWVHAFLSTISSHLPVLWEQTWPCDITWQPHPPHGSSFLLFKPHKDTFQNWPFPALFHTITDSGSSNFSFYSSSVKPFQLHQTPHVSPGVLCYRGSSETAFPLLSQGEV